MKNNWLNIVIALLLCIVIVGGLAILFREEAPSKPSENGNSTVGGNTSDVGGEPSEEYPVQGITLNEITLLF